LRKSEKWKNERAKKERLGNLCVVERESRRERMSSSLSVTECCCCGKGRGNDDDDPNDNEVDAADERTSFTSSPSPALSCKTEQSFCDKEDIRICETNKSNKAEGVATSGNKKQEEGEGGERREGEEDKQSNFVKLKEAGRVSSRTYISGR